MVLLTRDGTPQQPRSLADGLRPPRMHACASFPWRTTARWTWRQADTDLGPAHAPGRRDPRVQCAGTINDVKAIAPSRTGRARLSWWTAPSRCPTCAWTFRTSTATSSPSRYKVYGPMGIGALYGREKLLDAMPPWMGGGEMIRSVSLEKSTWNDLPWKFEAGTPNVEGAVA